MENSDVNDTVPFNVEPLPEDEQPTPARKRGSRWVSITFLGVLALLLIGATSAFAGYASGIAQRKEAEVLLTSAKAVEQFELATQDIQNKNYQRARQRLEYVAQIDPAYPGLTQKLAEVLAQINATATPTPAPTPTIAPTLDTSGIEALFKQGQDLMFNDDWSGAIDSLLMLRKTDPIYKTVAIDGMLFMALRNRGLEKIARQADLEGGLYDLTLASRFGPLDYEAQGYINWVSLYITGASFWELDWAKVVEYFSQVGPALPGLTDRSGLTARERYRLGLKGYGTMLASAGDVCGAAEAYQLSLNIGPDPEVEQLLAEAYSACLGEVTEESPPAEVPPIIATETPLPEGTIPPPADTFVPPVETTPPAEITPYPPPPAP